MSIGQISSGWPPLALAAGQLAGLSVYRKFGINPAVGTVEAAITELGTVWQPTAATTVEAISSSANDAAAGSGARTITIQGLNSSFVEVSDVVTMNGMGATSATANSYIRINNVYVATSGTYVGSNAGDITVRVSGGGASILKMAAGYGRGLTSLYTVPANTTAYLSDVHLSSSSGKPVTFIMYTVPAVNTVAAPFSGKYAMMLYDQISAPVGITYTANEIAFAQKTDIWFTGYTGTGTSNASVEYLLTLKV